MRGLLVAGLLLSCGGTFDASDAGTDASPDGAIKKMDASPDVAPDAAEDTVPMNGTTVLSPNGTPLGLVDICVFQHPELPCTTSDGSGGFAIDLPASSETGLTLERSGYQSVLVPLTTAGAPLTYTIGVPTTASRTTLYGGFGAAYPDTTNGYVMLVGTLKGQTELGLDGATASLTPASGGGPFYLDTSGNPAPSATSTSTYSEIFFANVAPGTYTATLAPSTMTCTKNFGGWQAQQLDSARFPIVAGYETHVGMACAK
jgi:hypothetical protein